MGFGFEQLVAGKTAFVNLTRDLLVAEAFTPLPAGGSVIELLETMEPEATIIQACRRAKEPGYQLALDDFVPRPAFDPLLDLADIVTIDFRNPTGRDEKSMSRARPPAARCWPKRSRPPTSAVRPSSSGSGFGWRHQVETIEQALRLLGVRELRPASPRAAVRAGVGSGGGA